MDEVGEAKREIKKRRGGGEGRKLV